MKSTFWISCISFAAAALVCSATPAVAREIPNEDSLRKAFRFAFPAYEMMRTRQQSLTRPYASLNHFTQKARLSTPSDRIITGPNNDTLYSSAWLNLKAGPVELDLPELPGRYHSLEFMDLFTDAFAVLGTSDSGGKAQKIWIVGPEWRGKSPKSIRVLRAPTNDVWVLLRVLADGPSDIPNAQQAQTLFKLRPLERIEGAPSDGFAFSTPQMPSGEQFIKAANSALGRSPLPLKHRKRAITFRRAGILPGEPSAWERLSEATRATWNQKIALFYAELAREFDSAGIKRNGWRYPAPGLADFGTDDTYRSAIALSGLAALPLSEATYITASTDKDGQELDGSKSYKLVVPANVPVKAFWSLTMYESDGTGRWFLTENPINRYSIGNRTPDLKYEADGTLHILIQHQAPATAHNWLPSPRGRFRLTFRAYRPDKPLLDGTFLLNPVEANLGK